ncbi:MAG: hypothetical protein K2Z80_14640, partial [Xanthobacteraceae bacterium]|nr:hypothetical protein [Xanthobacteraceae bacterium]
NIGRKADIEIHLSLQAKLESPNYLIFPAYRPRSFDSVGLAPQARNPPAEEAASHDGGWVTTLRA